MIFKLGELFCGPGGLALGAGLTKPVRSVAGEEFSISHVWGVDKDEAAIKTYKHNIVKKYGGVGLCLDAMQFSRKEIEDHKRITALAFGFPCNDFSLVGEQKGVNGQYGELYKAGIEVINRCNPYWFIAENVSGIHSANQGEAFKKILSALKNAGDHGYKLTAHLYHFEDYGVPQYRHRFIIVGVRKDKHLEFNVPKPTHGDKGKKDHVSVKEAILTLSRQPPVLRVLRQAGFRFALSAVHTRRA